MPNYDFRCEECKGEFSESLPMGTIVVPMCPTCKNNESVRKLIRAPMVHFKGSGFYKTDSSGTAKAKPKGPAAETSKATEAKPEVKPAETKTIEKKAESKK